MKAAAFIDPLLSVVESKAGGDEGVPHVQSKSRRRGQAGRVVIIGAHVIGERGHGAADAHAASAEPEGVQRVGRGADGEENRHEKKRPIHRVSSRSIPVTHKVPPWAMVGTPG